MTLVGVVVAIVIAVALAANHGSGSGTYPDAAAAVMKEAGTSGMDIAAAYCGITASDLTKIASPDNSEIPAKDWLPGTGPEDWNYRYSSPMGNLAFSDTGDFIVRCPNGAVGTIR